MARLTLIGSALFILIAAGNAQADYNPGLQAVMWHSANAEGMAAKATARSLSAKKLDNYEFYHNYINYRGFMHLSQKVLASKTFQRRLDVFNKMKHEPWGPFDYYNLKNANDAAKAARRAVRQARASR